MGRNKMRGIMVAIGTLVGQTVAGATNYVSAGSGFWRDQQNWYPIGIPGCGDTVTIQNGHTIEVDDAQQVTSVTVQSGGQLNLVASDASGGQLTFCAAGTPSLAVYTLNGVDLRDSGTALRFEKSLTIAGTGSVRGRASDAAMVLLTGDAAQDVVLTSTILIHGALVIKEAGGGDGFFYNIGGVSADAPGKVLELHPSLDGVGDISGGACIAPMWTAMASGAVLRFGTPANLAGDFRVGPGTLDIDAPVHTDGRLTFASGGVIIPHPPACFSYGGHCGGCQLFPWVVCLPVRCH